MLAKNRVCFLLMRSIQTRTVDITRWIIEWFSLANYRKSENLIYKMFWDEQWENEKSLFWQEKSTCTHTFSSESINLFHLSHGLFCIRLEIVIWMWISKLPLSLSLSPRDSDLSHIYSTPPSNEFVDRNGFLRMESRQRIGPKWQKD